MPGRLLENLMFFARTLRAAGLPIGPGRVIEALRAVETVGIGRREDFYWTLHSVFVNRQDQRPIFDQAFHVFWRNPQLLERMMAMLLPSIGAPDDANKGEEISRRLAEALKAERGDGEEGAAPEEEELEIDAAEMERLISRNTNTLARHQVMWLKRFPEVQWVGDADEIVKGEDDRAMAPLDQLRGHREILVPVGFSRSQAGAFGHRGFSASA